METRPKCVSKSRLFLVLDLFTLQCEINVVKKDRCFVILLKKCRVMFCEH